MQVAKVNFLAKSVFFGEPLDVSENVIKIDTFFSLAPVELNELL